jgi:hypothetical protein
MGVPENACPAYARPPLGAAGEHAHQSPRLAVVAVSGSSFGHTPDGDPTALDGALDRLAKGQPLRPIDLQELGYGLGRREALRLAAEVEARRAVRAAQQRRGWWGRLVGGPVHAGRVPLPDALARLIRRIRSGQPVTSDEVRGLARRVGRAQVRRIARTLSRSTARRAAARGRGRSTRRGMR